MTSVIISREEASKDAGFVPTKEWDGRSDNYVSYRFSTLQILRQHKYTPTQGSLTSQMFCWNSSREDVNAVIHEV